MQEEKSAVMAF